MFVENVKVSNIIKDFVNVYNMKKAIKFVNKTLIKEKLKSDIRRRRIKFNFYYATNSLFNIKRRNIYVIKQARDDRFDKNK